MFSWFLFYVKFYCIFSIILQYVCKIQCKDWMWEIGEKLWTKNNSRVDNPQKATWEAYIRCWRVKCQKVSHDLANLWDALLAYFTVLYSFLYPHYKSSYYPLLMPLFYGSPNGRRSPTIRKMGWKRSIISKTVKAR